MILLDKLTDMMDSIIAQYGMESHYTICFCQMCEDYANHGLFSMEQIHAFYQILKED